MCYVPSLTQSSECLLPPQQAQRPLYHAHAGGLLSPSLAAQRQYWRDTLAGVPSKPGFRTDFELSAGLNSPGKYIRVVVPQKLTQSLESLAVACAAPLITLGMAAWQGHHHGASSSQNLQSNCCRTVTTDIRNQLKAHTALRLCTIDVRLLVVACNS